MLLNAHNAVLRKTSSQKMRTSKTLLCLLSVCSDDLKCGLGRQRIFGASWSIGDDLMKNSERIFFYNSTKYATRRQSGVHLSVSYIQY